LHTTIVLAEEQRKTDEDTPGRKEMSKQEARHQTARLQDVKAEQLVEYVERLKKVAREIERGREWQRWYDEVYAEKLWEVWEVGDEMPVTDVFVDAWCAGDEQGSECGCREWGYECRVEKGEVICFDG